MQEDIFLGLDYGEARVGVSRSYGTLAEPLSVLLQGESLFAQIQQLCQQHHITHLVVGISEREMAEKSREFGVELSELTQLPVSFADETLSSVEVQKKLRERYQGKQTPRGPIDHYAAAVILQQFLDDHLA